METLETVIKVENLRKVYKLGTEKVIALGCVNLEIHRGEICCILGTSGSGKSTLLNMLAGLEKPTKGHIYIGKHDIPKLNEKQLAKLRQKQIGFVFQSYNLLPALTAQENVGLPLMFRGVSKAKRNREAEEMLIHVGLEKRLKHKPTQMSGGQQQRVGIARAFVCKPQIVFADEPTGNLDTKTTKEVMDIMVGICRQYHMTLVLVTHDPSIAKYADRIVTLIDGAIVSDVENQSIAEPVFQLESSTETPEEKKVKGKKRKAAPTKKKSSSLFHKKKTPEEPPAERQPQAGEATEAESQATETTKVETAPKAADSTEAELSGGIENESKN
ncbi:MAG: ABC transporter ATP-binding protein [Oscillospiraceae bacterium]|nr:ABC transporter ATP-binding protein [Oscillospiraceae bacterium]